jgi:hypothetical protein
MNSIASIARATLLLLDVQTANKCIPECHIHEVSHKTGLSDRNCRKIRDVIQENERKVSRDILPNTRHPQLFNTPILKEWSSTTQDRGLATLDGCIRSGNMIVAIKVVREHTGLSLADSMRVVRDNWEEWRALLGLGKRRQK